MKKLSREFSLRLLSLILRPVAAFCFRHALKLQDLIEAAKTSMVAMAKHELEKQSARVNTSRVALMSGVHRRDVQRLDEGADTSGYEVDMVTKVIGLWQTDRNFTTKQGEPRVLTHDGATSEFFDLVQRVSTDVNPGTVLFELQRIRAVEVTSRGLRLAVESHVPEGNSEEGFAIYARDASDLARSVESNVLEKPEIPHFHARTEFDNVRPEALAELKRWFLREGHLFHSRVREIVSKHDQDVNPKKDFQGKGVRVVFSAFSFMDEQGDKEEEK